MIVYWAFVIIPAFFAIWEYPYRNQSIYKFFTFLLLFCLFFFMAFRETAGDYSTYLRLFNILKEESFTRSVQITEPVYGALNWMSGQFGFGLYGVNVVGAVLFLSAIYQLAKHELLPYFLLAISIPYFVIVVGMGYTRQGMAAAVLIFALLQLRKGNVFRFVAMIAVAAGFHYSVAVYIILPIFSKLKGRSLSFSILFKLALIVAGLLAVPTLFQQNSNLYIENYIVSDRYQSGGAFLRALVTAIAGVLLLLYGRAWRRRYDDYSIWRIFAVISILLLPLSFIASTPVDRMGLFLLPFQILTFARIPTFQTSVLAVYSTKVAIIVAYMFYFYTWLNLGSYSVELWVPYRWLF